MSALTRFLESSGPRRSLYCTLAECSLMLLAVTALLTVQPVDAAQVLIPNSDLVLNHHSQAIYGYVFKMSPNEFDPVQFVSEMFNFYRTVDATISEEQLALVEWCAWPNATYTADGLYPSFCRNGVKTNNVSGADYVLAAFRLYSSNALTLASKKPLLPAPYSNPTTNGGTVRPTDPALFDPDLLVDDTHAGFVETIYRDSVALWAFFGCLIGLAVVVILVMLIVRCVRDKRQRERNTNMLRGAVHQHHRDHMSLLKSVGAGDHGRRGKKRGSRQYGTENPNEIRSRYDVGSCADGDDYGAVASMDDPGVAAASSGIDGVAAAASAQPTSRASAYWPGEEGAAASRSKSSKSLRNRNQSGTHSTSLRGESGMGDREMETRSRGEDYDETGSYY